MNQTFLLKMTILFRTFSKFGSTKSQPFARSQFQPFALYDSLDDLVRGLTNQESQKMDHFVSEAV